MKTEIINVVVMEMFSVVSVHSFPKDRVKEAEEQFVETIKAIEDIKILEAEFEDLIDNGYYACSNDLKAVSLVWSENTI